MSLEIQEKAETSDILLSPGRGATQKARCCCLPGAYPSQRSRFMLRPKLKINVCFQTVTILRILIGLITYEDAPHQQIVMPEREHKPDYARHPVPKDLYVPAVG